MNFSVTYEIITPESASCGDAEERGFEVEDVSLSEAIDALGTGSCLEANCYPFSVENPPRWVTAYNVDEDIATGAVTSRSLHFPRNISASSAVRLARLLGA